VSRDDVIDVACSVADEEGLEAVTLAAVAARVGIRSPSLYAHVNGLDDLRRLVALRAAAALALELERAAEGRTGLAALREIALAYRRFATGHRGLYAAAQRAVRPGDDDELYNALAAAAMPAIRALAEAGVARAERVHLTRAFRSALHGFVVLEQSSGFGMPESVDESFRHLVDLLLTAVQSASRRDTQP
jgi:AcrR family transcriptional regulator